MITEAISKVIVLERCRLKGVPTLSYLLANHVRSDRDLKLRCGRAMC